MLSRDAFVVPTTPAHSIEASFSLSNFWIVFNEALCSFWVTDKYGKEGIGADPESPIVATFDIPIANTEARSDLNVIFRHKDLARLQSANTKLLAHLAWQCQRLPLRLMVVGSI